MHYFQCPSKLKEQNSILLISLKNWVWRYDVCVVGSRSQDSYLHVGKIDTRLTHCPDKYTETNLVFWNLHIRTPIKSIWKNSQSLLWLKFFRNLLKMVCYWRHTRKLLHDHWKSLVIIFMKILPTTYKIVLLESKHELRQRMKTKYIITYIRTN